MPRRRYSRKKVRRGKYHSGKARDGWIKQAQQAPVRVLKGEAARQRIAELEGEFDGDS